MLTDQQLEKVEGFLQLHAAELQGARSSVDGWVPVLKPRVKEGIFLPAFAGEEAPCSQAQAVKADWLEALLCNVKKHVLHKALKQVSASLAKGQPAAVAKQLLNAVKASAKQPLKRRAYVSCNVLTLRGSSNSILEFFKTYTKGELKIGLSQIVDRGGRILVVFGLEGTLTKLHADWAPALNAAWALQFEVGGRVLFGCVAGLTPVVLHCRVRMLWTWGSRWPIG